MENIDSIGFNLDQNFVEEPIRPTIKVWVFFFFLVFILSNSHEKSNPAFHH